MPVDADAHAGSVATHFVERERFFKDCSVIQIEAARVTTMETYVDGTLESTLSAPASQIWTADCCVSNQNDSTCTPDGRHEVGKAAAVKSSPQI